MPIPTAAVLAGATPPVDPGPCVEGGAFVVSTTVPDVVVTITLPDVAAEAEAMEVKIWLADCELYVVVVKLQRVRIS
jgi:hypothetical protein